MLQAIDLECVRGERCLFQGLGLELSPGQCLHIAGDNGAGKTSLLRILAGLLTPTRGQVRWKGSDITRTREEYGSELAFVGHLNGIKDDLTVLENVRFEAAVRGLVLPEGQAREALARLGLEDFEDVAVRYLSQGQKRRVALTRLCAPVPARLWILDEPFNALDARTVERVYALVEQHLAADGIVVLTAHQKVDLPSSARRLDLFGWPLA
ncbi:MAG TPA: cytochrome c biogenesis heme-transporting ATPase CcmA [Burkholderiaceae bacterium]|nr:cytochrome c biogenesis heme-transporting ATPase CcmA [Burkholderiaceae bacterium]